MTTTRNLPVVALAWAALLGMTSTAQALIIDDFDVEQLVITSAAAPSAANNSAVAGLGTNRNIRVDKTAGRSGIVNRAIAEVTNGVLGASNGPVTNSVITVTWTGIPNLDLTEAGAAVGIVMALPNPIDNDLTVAFSINDSSTIQTTFPNGAFGTAFYFDYVDFTVPSALTSVTKIVMTLTNGVAGDAQVDFIGTRRPPTVTVPAPAPLLLIGAGLLGLGAGRGKRG